MGNRAAVFFGDHRNENTVGVYLHWNGGPESIYAFTKQLANYARSQHPDSDSGPAASPPAMAARFVQLTANYFSSSASDFTTVYVEANAGTPQACGMDTENDVFVVHPDFSIARFSAEDGKEWTDEQRLAEFRAVQRHAYWSADDTIFEGIRAANDPAFLRAYAREGEKWHEHCEAALPIEREVQVAEVEKIAVKVAEPER